MKEFFRKLFCNHRYVKVRYRQEMDYQKNIRYALRQYTCVKCGKTIFVDSRCDPYTKG